MRCILRLAVLFCMVYAVYPGNDDLLIGVFNVQVFGVTKSEDQDVSNILIKVSTC